MGGARRLAGRTREFATERDGRSLPEEEKKRDKEGGFAAGSSKRERRRLGREVTAGARIDERNETKAGHKNFKSECGLAEMDSVRGKEKDKLALCAWGKKKKNASRGQMIRSMAKRDKGQDLPAKGDNFLEEWIPERERELTLDTAREPLDELDRTSFGASRKTGWDQEVEQ